MRRQAEGEPPRRAAASCAMTGAGPRRCTRSARSAGAGTVVPLSGSTTASLQTGPDVFGATLPQPLDAVNADRYRQIFRMQAMGDFVGSDRLISDLTDPVLLGQ